MIKSADEDMEWFLEDFELTTVSAEKAYALPEEDEKWKEWNFSSNSIYGQNCSINKKVYPLIIIDINRKNIFLEENFL